MDGFKVINFFYSRRANLFNHVFDRPKDEEWICISCVKKMHSHVKFQGRNSWDGISTYSKLQQNLPMAVFLCITRTWDTRGKCSKQCFEYSSFKVSVLFLQSKLATCPHRLVLVHFKGLVPSSYVAYFALRSPCCHVVLKSLYVVCFRWIDHQIYYNFTPQLLSAPVLSLRIHFNAKEYNKCPFYSLIFLSIIL